MIHERHNPSFSLSPHSVEVENHLLELSTFSKYGHNAPPPSLRPEPLTQRPGISTFCRGFHAHHNPAFRLSNI